MKHRTFLVPHYL